jgi:hypothetical protein
MRQKIEELSPAASLPQDPAKSSLPKALLAANDLYASCETRRHGHLHH